MLNFSRCDRTNIINHMKFKKIFTALFLIIVIIVSIKPSQIIQKNLLDKVTVFSLVNNNFIIS